MVSVSIVTITNRMGGIDVLVNDLLRQTFQDFELVLVDGQYLTRCKAVESYLHERLRDINVIYIPDPPKIHDRLSNLNAALNEGLRRVHGETIVFLQDYLWIPEDAVEKLVSYCRVEHLVSAVGHKYIPDGHDPLIDPVNVNGHVSIFDHDCACKPEGVRTFEDPRITGCQQLRRAFMASEWEGHCAAIPRKIIVDELGGYSEAYDEGWTYDNVFIADRAHFLGYDILVAEDIEVYGLDHEVYFPNKINKPENLNGRRHWEMMHRIWMGEQEVRCGSLRNVAP